MRSNAAPSSPLDRDGVSAFGALLGRLRVARGMSQRAFQRAMGFSSLSIVQRSEAGHRTPADADEVLRMAAVLSLPPAERDELLVRAGHWPKVLLDLGPLDGTLLRIAAALVRARERPASAAGLRRVLEAVAEAWPDEGGAPRAGDQADAGASATG